MDGRVVPIARTAGRQAARPTSRDSVAALCARPKCRKEFVRGLQRGRRQDYCSDKCRLLAADERRHIRARLKHYQRIVSLLEADLNAFTVANAGEAIAPSSPVDAFELEPEIALAVEVGRAEGVLELTDNDDPVARRLAGLVAAVRHRISSQK